jgi:hypothetical protein
MTQMTKLASVLFPKFAAKIGTLLLDNLTVHDPRNNANGPRTHTKNAFFSCCFVLCFGYFVDRMTDFGLSMLREL